MVADNVSPTAITISFPALQRARGAGRIGTYQRDGTTCLQTLYQEGCAKIRLPRTHSRAIEAVLINTAGGLTGGDDIEWQASLAAGGLMVLTTQACERIYRSIGGAAKVATQLHIGGDAHLDWLPQETILFQASKLDRRIQVDLEQGASLTAVEAILLGRDAMGETARDAQLVDNWRIRREGRLVHAEATRLTGSAAERDGIALLSGCRAFATILHIAATDEHAKATFEGLNAALPRHGRIAASRNGERIVIRAMAESGLALRRLIVPTLTRLSGSGSLPRLWHL